MALWDPPPPGRAQARAEAVASMAGSYFHMNNFEKAVKMYLQLLKLAEGLEDESMQLDTFKWLAESCYQMGDFQAWPAPCAAMCRGAPPPPVAPQTHTQTHARSRCCGPVGAFRLDRRVEEVAKAVVGSYCRLQMSLRLALGVGETVSGHRLGALEGGGGGQSNDPGNNQHILNTSIIGHR